MFGLRFFANWFLVQPSFRQLMTYQVNFQTFSRFIFSSLIQEYRLPRLQVKCRPLQENQRTARFETFFTGSVSSFSSY